MSTENRKPSKLPVVLGMIQFALVLVAYGCMKSGPLPAGDAGLSLTSLPLHGYQAFKTLTQPGSTLWALLGLEGRLSPRMQWLVIVGNSMLWGYALAWAYAQVKRKKPEVEEIS